MMKKQFWGKSGFGNGIGNVSVSVKVESEWVKKVYSEQRTVYRKNKLSVIRSMNSGTVEQEKGKEHKAQEPNLISRSGGRDRED